MHLESEKEMQFKKKICLNCQTETLLKVQLPGLGLCTLPIRHCIHYLNYSIFLTL